MMVAFPENHGVNVVLAEPPTVGMEPEIPVPLSRNATLPSGCWLPNTAPTTVDSPTYITGGRASATGTTEVPAKGVAVGAVEAPKALLPGVNVVNKG